MKLLKTFIMILAIGMVLAACNSKDKEDANEVENQNEVKQEEKQNITIESKSLINEEGEPFLDISYPIISGMTDKKTEEELNQIFFNTAKQLEEDARLQEKQLNDLGAPEHVIATLEVKEKISTERFISINSYVYINAGGTGMEYHNPFVYDLVEKKEITFKDLFENNKIPKQELIDVLNNALTTGDYADMVLETITELSDDQAFYLTEESIVFLFSKYEYTAGAAGAPEISIPKSSISSLKEVYQ